MRKNNPAMAGAIAPGLMALTAALLASTPLSSAFAEDADHTTVDAREPASLPSITVYGQHTSPFGESLTDLKETPPRLPYADGGAYLRATPGITAGRGGGHGLDPTIRGQSQNQLNILSNGAATFGGCPNRMDPPTSYAGIESFDIIKVVRGYQSVLYGPGGSGGTILLEHERPDLGPEMETSGDLSAGFESNSDTRFASGYTLVGDENAYARLTASVKDAGDYEDGDGDEVPSSYFEYQGGATLGFTPGDDTHLHGGYTYHRVDDARFPGAGMDSVLSETNSLTAGLEHNLDEGPVRRIEASAYASLVDHVMDNFSLRQPSIPSFARADSDSDTFGGALKTELDLAGQRIGTTIDFRQNNRDAIRRAGPSAAAVTMVQSILWPDITIEELGLAAETTFEPAERTRLVTGLRYDYVSVDYGKADTVAMMTGRSPNNLYTAFYGVTASDQTEHNVGGLVRLEHDASNEVTLFAAASRSVRTADATERGLANDRGLDPANQSWVGNPEIDPEKHHQIELGATRKDSDWEASASVYADYVDDYILRDSARGQDGILITAVNADVYRNIDALLAGVELRGEWALSDELRLKADIAYTYGEDRDSGDALPQIPPLQGALHIDWQALDMVELGGSLRYAFEQTRVDTNPLSGTGRDVGKTGGYAIVDLVATLKPVEDVELALGVTNLFDVTYANHLNRSNVFDASEVQVNEPGRAFFVRGRMAF